jgi:hypothetical protein
MGKFIKNELKEENNCPNTGQTLDNASVINIHDLEASNKTIEESREKQMKLKKILNQISFTILLFFSKFESINVNDFSVNVNNNEEIENFEDVIEESDDENIDIPNLLLNYVIIDCTPITYIDSVGVHTLHQVYMIYLILN